MIGLSLLPSHMKKSHGTAEPGRFSRDNRVPAQVYRSRPVQALENSAADCACLINDLFSYQKEIQFEGEIHNCVLVVQNFLGCDSATAMGVVGDLMAARMSQFRDIVAVELPQLFDALHFDAATRESLLDIDHHVGIFRSDPATRANVHCHRNFPTEC